MAHDGTLIVSISGIRGIFGDGLDPEVLVRYASAYGAWCRDASGASRPTVVVGRDARVTGPLCAEIVMSTLQSVGCDVIDAGLATTPTVEMAVLFEEAAGGIILSASHNPAEWNALKLLNGKGEFLSPEEGEDVIARSEATERPWVRFDGLGTRSSKDYLDDHVDAILEVGFVDADAIRARNFRVVVDGVNSVGGVALPELLRRLGLAEDQVVVINGEPTGRFAHPAEPLPAHLTGLMEAVREHGADLGLAVDPDADRLALVDETGTYVSEELTQVLAADFLWRFRPGAFATNLSSSRAIEDVAARYEGASVYRSAVGEINVVKKMQAVDAVLGGEGNGGVILPDLHYGRDALVGTAMILQHLAEENLTLSEWRSEMPRYAIVKDKLPLGDLDVQALLRKVAARYEGERLSTVDGLKIDLSEGWVHMRPSNTEPILRVYAEAETAEQAQALADRLTRELSETH